MAESEKGSEADRLSVSASGSDPAGETTQPQHLWAWYLYSAAFGPISGATLPFFAQLAVTVSFKRDSPPAWLASLKPETYISVLASGATLLQAVLFISLGGLADFGPWRKRLLLVATLGGSAAAIGMAPGLALFPSCVLAGVLLVAINGFYGLATVFHNAYLPLLVSHHPEYDGDRDEGGEDLTSELSSRAFALAYGAVVLVLALLFGFVFLHTRMQWVGDAMALATSFTGLWWFLLGLYPLVALPLWPGPSFSATHATNVVVFNWRRFSRALRHAFRNPRLRIFILCCCSYSNGYNALASLAANTADSQLRLSVTQLAGCALLAPIFALLGGMFFMAMQSRLGLTNRTVLVTTLFLMALLPFYATGGALNTRFGVRQQWEAYPLIASYGFLVGALQNQSRICFGELVLSVDGKGGEYFSIFALAERGSSCVALLLVALLRQFFTDIHWCFLPLAFMLLVPAIVLLCID